MQDNEKEVSQKRGAALWRIFKTYPTVRICRDLLAQYIFERPFIVENENRSFALDQSEWASIGRDIMDSAMAVGIAIVRVRSGELPSVVPWDLCSVTVHVDSKFRRVFRVYPTRMEDGDHSKPLRDVFVLDLFGMGPDHEGNLNSLMVPLRLKIYTVLDQLQCMVDADRSRCRPTIITETHEDSSKPAEEVQYDYYADASSLERNSLNTFVRNKNALQELSQQQAMFKDMFETTAASGSAGDGENLRSKAMDSVLPLPLGCRMSRSPQAESPESLVDRLRFMEQEVFVIMGVPRSFCMHDITVRHDAGMLHCTFTRTVHKWQQCIGDALTFMYNIYSMDTATVAKVLQRKRRRAPSIADAAKDKKSMVRFERMPRVGVQELSYAFDRGVITWGGYSRQMATFCGISGSDVNQSPKDPWSREEHLLGWTMQRPKSDFSDGAPGQSNRTG
tara:strand:- start:2197 stop:3540 length:1344 start_codon:yes stop_codon:yes gene_type:complete